jgi:hypothetical protein
LWVIKGTLPTYGLLFLAACLEAGGDALAGLGLRGHSFSFSEIYNDLILAH